MTVVRSNCPNILVFLGGVHGLIYRESDGIHGNKQTLKKPQKSMLSFCVFQNKVVHYPSASMFEFCQKEKLSVLQSIWETVYLDTCSIKQCWQVVFYYFLITMEPRLSNTSVIVRFDYRPLFRRIYSQKLSIFSVNVSYEAVYSSWLAAASHLEGQTEKVNNSRKRLTWCLYRGEGSLTKLWHLSPFHIITVLHTSTSIFNKVKMVWNIYSIYLSFVRICYCFLNAKL